MGIPHSFWPSVMGVLMILAAVLNLFREYTLLEIVSVYYLVIPVEIIGGLLLLRFRGENTMRIIGISAVSVGTILVLENLMRAWELRRSDILSLIEDDLAELAMLAEIAFAFSVACILLSAVNFEGGIRYLLGDNHDSRRMRFSTVIQIMLNVFLIVSSYMILRDDTSGMDYMIGLAYGYVPITVFCVLYLIILSSDEVKRKNDPWKVERELYYLRAGFALDPRSYILRGDMERLASCLSGGGWDRTEVDGTTECESVFDISCPKSRGTQLLLQKRRDGRILLYTAPRMHGSFGVSEPIEVVSAEPDGTWDECGTATVAGKNACLVLNVSDGKTGLLARKKKKGERKVF